MRELSPQGHCSFISPKEPAIGDPGQSGPEEGAASVTDQGRTRWSWQEHSVQGVGPGMMAEASFPGTLRACE